MISHDLKCVFVHVTKVAGQSIEMVFLKHHGLTWKTRAPLLLRSRTDKSEGPPRLAHLTAQDYVACGHLTPEEWDAYFTFSFVRNPWARVVSFYKYLGDHRVMPFDRFVREQLAETYWERKRWMVRPQADFICDDQDRILVDFVGRLETITTDFAEVARRVGLPDATLPHRNPSDAGPWARAHWRGLRNAPEFVRGALRQRRHEKTGPYAAYYDPETAALVGRLYARDAELFGYRFEDLAGR